MPVDLMRCVGVSQSFGEAPDAVRHVLQDVTCELPAGRLVALMGPSGSGKSTLLNVVGGLQPPSAGAVTVAGERVDEMSAVEATAFRGRRVGFVFQEWNLLHDLTIIENVALPLRLKKVPGRDAARRAREALERVGVAEHASRFPASLSGGEQQRTAIARAVVDDRPLILADEPTGALDQHNGHRVMELLRELIDGGERSCLIATHDEAVAQMCHEVWRIQDGHLETPRP